MSSMPETFDASPSSSYLIHCFSFPAVSTFSPLLFESPPAVLLLVFAQEDIYHEAVLRRKNRSRPSQPSPLVPALLRRSARRRRTAPPASAPFDRPFRRKRKRRLDLRPGSSTAFVRRGVVLFRALRLASPVCALRVAERK